jgi:hypothetical protein
MRRGAVPFALALVLLAHCRRQEVAGFNVAPSAAAVAQLAAESPPAPPADSPVPVPVPAVPAAAPGEAAASDSAPPSRGTWLEGNIYRFRLEDVRACPPPAVGAAARVAATVRVSSKINELLVAPRDVKLEAGGVILDSAIAPKAPAGCAPLLAPKSLRAGKSSDGVVLFDLPPGFNAERRPVKITYQPTRWGGAKRVEAILPAESLPR